MLSPKLQKIKIDQDKKAKNLGKKSKFLIFICRILSFTS